MWCLYLVPFLQKRRELWLKKNPWHASKMKLNQNENYSLIFANRKYAPKFQALLNLHVVQTHMSFSLQKVNFSHFWQYHESEWELGLSGSKMNCKNSPYAIYSKSSDSFMTNKLKVCRQIILLAGMIRL